MRPWSVPGTRHAWPRCACSFRPIRLFNLLHTIRGQIQWDPQTAQKMIIQLSDLLRRLLAAGESEFTPLAAEIEFARLYLGLQQQRFADRLTLALPERCSLPEAWVPSLILQPLIENAVVHGLAGHQRTGARQHRGAVRSAAAAPDRAQYHRRRPRRVATASACAMSASDWRSISVMRGRLVRCEEPAAWTCHCADAPAA